MFDQLISISGLKRLTSLEMFVVSCICIFLSPLLNSGLSRKDLNLRLPDFVTTVNYKEQHGNFMSSGLQKAV